MWWWHTGDATVEWKWNVKQGSTPLGAYRDDNDDENDDKPYVAFYQPEEDRRRYVRTVRSVGHSCPTIALAGACEARIPYLGDQLFVSCI